MASALQIHPQHDDMNPLPDPASPLAAPASVPGVAYDLKRLKVYSSCLRCRAKKVKCDRKEPCSRCEKHSVECSYRELASVQLDIRQFQRHLNNPKIRKDGSGIITSTATPVITMTPSPTPLSSSSSAPQAVRPAITAVIPSKAASPTGALSTASSPSSKNFAPSTSSSAAWSAGTTINTFASYPGSNTERSQPGTSGSTDTDSDSNYRNNNPSHRRPRVPKVHRRKPSSHKGFGLSLDHDRALHADLRAISDHVDRVQLTEDAMAPDTSMSSASDGEGAHQDGGDMDNHDEGEDYDNNHDPQEDVPIWRVQAVGKHKQTAHEQDMAETFGLAAYLKAREMEIAQDPAQAGQTLDFDVELEKALAQRMPSSFSRPDRSFSRARKNAPNGYSPKMPYARPSYCQLSSGNNHSHKKSRQGNNGSGAASGPHSASLNALLTAAQCCCQISALQGQALSVCPYSNVSHSGYDKPRLTLSSSATVAPDSATPPSAAADSASLPPPSPKPAEGGARIAYSPSYSPTYNPRDVPPVATAAARAAETSQSSYPSPQEQESPLWQYTPSSKLFSSASSTFVTNSTRLPSLSVAAPCLTPDACSMDVDVVASSPRTELPPILSLAAVTSTVSSSSSTTPSSDLTAFQVGKDGEAPIQIECKYNEPNVDAWDMIEKPISRTIPLTTKRGRSIKMEMGWILS